MHPDPLVHEIESYHEPLLVVSHQASSTYLHRSTYQPCVGLHASDIPCMHPRQAVLRVLYSYLRGIPRARCPKIEIPLHTVLKITYDGWNEVPQL